MTSNNNTETATQYLDAPCFHKKFTLPPSASRPTELNVTYADFGHQNTENVVLFCGPLVGSRYVLASKDSLAKHHSIRILSPDRPGFGGTTDAGPADRVRVWLEIVQALLRHLSIQHVSILGYSGGAIYAVNVLLHLRHVLHPTRPYVALCAPWVHPSHSDVSMLKLAALLPGALVGSYDRVVKFVTRNIFPAIQFSGDILRPVTTKRDAEYMAPGADTAAVAFEENLTPELIHRLSRENVQGLGQDALLLIKRDDYPGCWGAWGDYDALVPVLAEVERERLEQHDSDAVSPLRVDVFFAESDHMIGETAGPAWFDACWRPEIRGEGICYRRVVVPCTNHDGLLNLRYGVVERIFRGMASLD